MVYHILPVISIGQNNDLKMSYFKKHSINPQKRVLLGPEGKRYELVGDRREARERQCAVDELLAGTSARHRPLQGRAARAAASLLLRSLP